METWMIQLMEDLGYIGILILIAVENLFPPIPSEIILSFGGFMTTQSDMTLTGVITFATIGSLIGAVILVTIMAKHSAKPKYNNGSKSSRP